MSYSTEVLADSPIGYWRLGDAVGGVTAVDSSTGGNPGTYLNAPTLGVTGAVVGSSDTAVTFTAASSQDMRVAFWSGLNISSFTLEAWAKSTNTNVPIVSRQGGAAAAYGMWIDPAGRLALTIKTGGTTSGGTITGTTINDGAWHHVAISHDWSGSSAVVTFYVDGASVGTGSNTFLPTLTRSDGLAVASRGSTPFLNGSIDEPAIYNTVLTGTRIAAHYAARTTADALSGVWGLVS